MEVGSLPNDVNSYVLCVCLLFDFRLFTVIDLSLGVLYAQHTFIPFWICCGMGLWKPIRSRTELSGLLWWLGQYGQIGIS